MLESNEMPLFRDNNIDRLKLLDSESVDLIIADFDYGFGKISRKKWAGQDLSICFDLMRVLKPHGVIVGFTAGLFTFELYSAMPKHFKYMTIWDKGRPTGHLNAKKMPMLQHENLLIFAKNNKHTYNPQMWKGLPPKSVGKAHGVDYAGDSIYNKHKRFTRDTDMKYPRSIIKFDAVNPTVKQYPTEKPIELMEYLVKTYSHLGDTVLDPACGSGKALVAAKLHERKHIGIDNNPDAITLSRRNLERII